MMRYVQCVLVLSLLVLFSRPVVAQTGGKDFEGLNDNTPITQYAGLSFANSTVVASGLSLNEFEFPPHSGHNVAFDDGGPMTITFNGGVSSFSGYFTHTTKLTLTGFDAANNPVVSKTTVSGNNMGLAGETGSAPNELVELSFAGGISKVVISGAAGGSSFTLDDIDFNSANNRPPVARAGAPQTIECAGGQTTVTLNGTASSDPDGDALTYQWNEGPVTLGTGSTLNVSLSMGSHTIALTVTDPGGQAAHDTVLINVVDTTAPTISGASANPSSLWSPNHQMRDVTLNYNTADTCNSGTGATCTVEVSSNEPSTASSPDWVIVDAHHIRLRAERAGNGNGRIYTITITCTDASRNSSRKTLSVQVPHDSR
jgi:hypothetical protein